MPYAYDCNPRWDNQSEFFSEPSVGAAIDNFWRMLMIITMHLVYLQVPPLHHGHARGPVPHPAGHGQEGDLPLPGAPAALRHLHAVRHAVDLLYR